MNPIVEIFQPDPASQAVYERIYRFSNPSMQPSSRCLTDLRVENPWKVRASMPKKVFISGCYDLLHSGHIAFFQEAAQYGDLYVAIGSDQTVFDLKGRVPVNNEDERLFMVQAVSCVKKAFISRGSGMLDFIEELKRSSQTSSSSMKMEIRHDKQALCGELGIEYKILEREPHAGLAPRSTTALRTIDYPLSHRYRRGMVGSTVGFKILSWGGDHYFHRAHDRVQRAQWDGYQHPAQGD